MSMEWTGYAAATLTTLAFVPQAVKTIRTRDTRSLSLGMYLVFTIGIGCWFAYGIVLDSKGRPWFNEFGSYKIGMIEPATMQ